MAILMAATWFAIVTTLLACLAWQYFTYPVIRPRPAPSDQHLPFISVVVPARNEEANIVPCITHLLAQNYPRHLREIIVVDDNSTDRTPALIAALAKEGQQVALLSAGEIPSGWLGKTNACRVGAERARGDILIFLDADTFAGQGMISSCWAEMQERQCDLLSFTPQEEMLGFWERLVMPWGFLLLSLEMDFRKVNDPKRSEAAANGQCMMFRRTCYEAIGGHACVREEVMEDIQIAHVLKRSGFRLFFARGEQLASTRMYSRFSDLRHGFGRIVRRVLVTRKRALVHVAIAVVLALSPLAVLLGIREMTGAKLGLAMGIGLLASTQFLGIAVGMCRYFRIPAYWALLSSLGFAVWGAIVLDNLVIRRNRDIRWKARSLPP